jgi:predicted DNA binding protein
VPTVLRRGGKPQSITVADGRAEIVVELPASSNARNLVQYLESEFPESRLVSFHEHERPPQTKQECVNNAITHLTDRQQTALKTAFLSGYYESNREVSGAELADSMDVSQSTFHQHLRAAQRKVLAAVFDDELDE